MIWLTVAFVAGYLLAGFLNRRQYATLALRLHALESELAKAQAATDTAINLYNSRGETIKTLVMQARSNGTFEERRP